ncbi:hypothetical protein PMAYCL1PPCAC_04305, partial [Pristionchus mayeri]
EMSEEATVTKCFCNLVYIACTNVISIGFIVLGAINVDNCPVQPKIPIFLIVSGAVTIVGAVLNYFNYHYAAKKTALRTDQPPIEIKAITSLLSLQMFFAIGWCILGMIWTFGLSPTYEPGEPTYCDYWTYVVTLVNFILIFIHLGFVCCGCVCVCVACCTCCALSA